MNVSGSVSFSSTVDAFSTQTTAPVLAFGTIVTPYGKTSDGDLIKLVEPVYTEIIAKIVEDEQTIYQISPRRWEELVAAAYDKAGFDEVILTPRSGDLGRDVIAIKHGFGAVKFNDQVKAYNPGHVVTADEVRSLLGVLHGEQNASKAIFTTTSTFAPKIEEDRFIKPFIPYRLELVDKEKLKLRLSGSIESEANDK
jgi:restriction system protein